MSDDNETTEWFNNLRNQKAVGAITLLVLIALALFIIYGLIFYLFPAIGNGITYFVNELSSADAAITVALITGCISIVTVVVGGYINNRLRYKQQKREYLCLHREKPYEQLVRMYFKVHESSKTGVLYTPDEILHDTMEFNRGLTLWGSAKAIKLWNQWRLLSVKKDKSPKPYEVLTAMERVLFQLRKDLGNKGKLKEGDLLKLSVNDYDEKMGKA